MKLVLLLFISYYFSRKTDLCDLLPERFEKTVTHESKYYNISPNT